MKNNKKDLSDLIDGLDSISVEIAATHLNYVNGNNLLYTVDAIKNGGGASWTDQYKKPQLLHHDKHRDAVGRVMDYSIEDTATMDGEPNDYVKLKVEITDKDAIGKVLKGIYYTCSVGSSTSKVRCSICDQVLTTDGLCEHEKGSIVEGKKAYWIIDNITYKENSFVNNPADSYSRIVSIDIGDGPMAYETFLEDKENLITDFFMEDNMKIKDAKLSTEARKKLPDSAFCGPSRSFPAHDKAHVTAGLRLLNKSKFSDSTKQKIKGCLYRKGKRFGMSPEDSELLDNADLLVCRIDDDFSDEEQTIIATFFDENPDSDLPTDEEIADNGDETPGDNTDESETKTYTIDDYETIKDAEKGDILSFCDFLVGEVTKLTDTITGLTEEKSTLTDEISEHNTILNSKEDEIGKLLDDNAVLSVSYKKSLVDNILDFKQIKNREDETKKYDSRKVDSLVDTLVDFRSDSENTIPRVEDETLTNPKDSDNDLTSEKELEDAEQPTSRIDRFFKHNINTED